MKCFFTQSDYEFTKIQLMFNIMWFVQGKINCSHVSIKEY